MHFSGIVAIQNMKRDTFFWWNSMNTNFPRKYLNWKPWNSREILDITNTKRGTDTFLKNAKYWQVSEIRRQRWVRCMTKMWKTTTVSIMLLRNSLGKPRRRWGISKILEIIIGGVVKLIQNSVLVLAVWNPLFLLSQF